MAGYHEHFVRRLQLAQRRHLSDEALLVHIRTVYEQDRGAYGRPRIWRELRARGNRVGKLRLQRMMQQHGIRARGKRRFRITTTDSRHGLPIAPNLLDRNFTVAAPNQVWVGDVTYIAAEEGWLFLAVVMDLFSRRIVGWSLREQITREIVIDALRMAWFLRCPDRKSGLIFHSDRGSQYASACSETLFGSLKVEGWHGQHFETRRQGKDEAIDWLLWYNQTRLHSTLNYLSPMQFEQSSAFNTEASRS